MASRDEALLQAVSLPGIGVDQTWDVGLPRHDLLVAGELPPDLAREEARLRDRLGGRPLVAFWPAEGSAAPDEARLSELVDWAQRHDVVVGVRERSVDRSDSHTCALSGLAPIGLGDRAVSCSTLVHRVASVVVTDRAPEAFDALILGRPVVSYDDAALVEQLEACADGGFAERPRGEVDAAPDGLAARRLVHRIRISR